MEMLYINAKRNKVSIEIMVVPERSELNRIVVAQVCDATKA